MKIAFFDIDGTLLDVPNNMHEPALETIEALKKFQDAGNYIVIATARPVIPSSLDVLNYNGMICCDGHYIEINNEILVDNRFNVEELSLQEDVYNKHHGAFIFTGHYGEWFSDPINPLIKKHNLIYQGSQHVPLDKALKHPYDDIKVNAVTAIFSNTKDMFDAKDKLPSDWAINAYDEEHIRMDVHKPGFNKGTACQFVYNHLNINKEDTYAFGDGLNDVEMLSLVGHGVAMGNAVEGLKKVAKESCDTVTNNGIAKYFDEFIL